MQALALQGGGYLVPAGVDDAGAQEHPLRGQQGRDLDRQRNDHVGHDVGQHQVVPLPGQGPGQVLVLQDVARLDVIPRPVHAVQGGILIGHVHRLGVDVHRLGALRPQAQGRNGQNPAAAAQVQHPEARLGVGLHPLQAELGGGVCPGAEGQAGVQIERGPPWGDRLRPHPLRDHVEPGADLHGLVVLLPAVGPVVFRQGHGGVLPAKALGVPGQKRLAVRVVGNVEFHPAHAPHPLQKLLVHIVPVLPVLL